MRPLVIILGFGTLMLLFVPTAQAQSSPDFIFSSHECSPLSCIDEVGPTTVGRAAASFDGVCTGGRHCGDWVRCCRHDWHQPPNARDTSVPVTLLCSSII